MNRPTNETIQDYRTCFLSNESGRRVLAHLLREAGYFDVDCDETAVLNYAKKILVRLGLFQTDTSTIELVNHLADLPPEWNQPEKTDDERDD